MKNIVFISIIILVLAAIAVVLYFSTSPTPIELPTQTTTKAAGTTTATAPVDTGKFQPSAVTLEIKSWGYNPSTVTLMKGSTATWENKDNVVHTVTSTGNFDSGDIAPGKTWTYTFNKVGTFEYTCKHHPSMKATVVITE